MLGGPYVADPGEIRTIEFDVYPAGGSAWFKPGAEPAEAAYAARGAEAEREKTASGWPWGAWWLYVRAGVHFEDRGAVKDRYVTALGWAKARGSRADMQNLESLTGAIAEVYGGFPADWPRLGRDT